MFKRIRRFLDEAARDGIARSLARQREALYWMALLPPHTFSHHFKNLAYAVADLKIAMWLEIAPSGKGKRAHAIHLRGERQECRLADMMIYIAYTMVNNLALAGAREQVDTIRELFPHRPVLSLAECRRLSDRNPMDYPEIVEAFVKDRAPGK